MIEQKKFTQTYIKIYNAAYIQYTFPHFYIPTAIYWIWTRVPCVTSKSYNHYTLYYLFHSQTFLIYFEIARHPYIQIHLKHHISFTYFRNKESLFIFFSQQTLLNCRDNSRHISIFMITWHLALLGKYVSTRGVDVRAPQPLVFMPKCNAVDYARMCGGRIRLDDILQSTLQKHFTWSDSFKENL